jgi:hypothetical protein
LPSVGEGFGFFIVPGEHFRYPKSSTPVPGSLAKYLKDGSYLNPGADFLKKRIPGGYMDYTEIMRRLTGDGSNGAFFWNRRALSAAAVIHTFPMGILCLCLAMLSCHMLLA